MKGSVLAFKGAFRAVRTVVKTTDGAAMEQRFPLNKLGRKVGLRLGGLVCAESGGFHRLNQEFRLL